MTKKQDAKRVKSVSFNTADPYELALYTHSGKYGAFATYIKRLIARDMENGKAIDLTPYEKASKIYNEINKKSKKAGGKTNE
ncbi:hypothetical protein 015DV004_19 [Bacillus phage 015DV004]|nr:hypothetical protein 015DV004_19 [Bacillus phage 015DV004]